MHLLTLLLAVSQAGAAIPSIETAQRTETAGYVAGRYYLMDALIRQCAADGRRGEAWRASVMSAWVGSNKVLLAASRDYYQRLLAEREAVGGKARRERFLGMIRVSMQVGIGSLLGETIDKLESQGACKSISQEVAAGAYDIAPDLGARGTELIRTSAPFASPGNHDYRPLPFAVTK
jgi:hypothetical protein